MPAVAIMSVCLINTTSVQRQFTWKCQAGFQIL